MHFSAQAFCKTGTTFKTTDANNISFHLIPPKETRTRIPYLIKGCSPVPDSPIKDSTGWTHPTDRKWAGFGQWVIILLLITIISSKGPVTDRILSASLDGELLLKLVSARRRANAYYIMPRQSGRSGTDLAVTSRAASCRSATNNRWRYGCSENWCDANHAKSGDVFFDL